jgi:hypothetical protein
MDNKPTTLDKAVKVSIIAGTLIVTLSVAYYLVIFLPHKEKQILEQQQREQQARNDAKAESIKKLKECLNNAEKQRMEYLRLNGTEKKDGSISNSFDTIDMANKNRKDTQDNCQKLYPQ